MIRVCRTKALDRLEIFGCGLWYAQNISIIFSIAYFFHWLYLPYSDFAFWLGLMAFFNSAIGGLINLVFYDSTIWMQIKDRQKLFGWDDSC